MSHALRRTWEVREGRTLTVTGYRETGGIRSAVAQSAEDLYERVLPDHRSQLRDLLLRLLSPSLEGEAVRTRVPRRLISTDPVHEEGGVISDNPQGGARGAFLQGMLDYVAQGEGSLDLILATIDAAWPVEPAPA